MTGRLADGRQRASYREVFAVREYRAMWSAQVLSLLGNQFAQVSIAILVYHRTHSAFLTALAYSLTYLPPIIGGPLLSGLADLFPRRRVLISCDLVRAFFVTAMAIPAVPFWALCLLLLLTVLAGVPFSAARAALLPDVLPGDKLVLGSAIGAMTHQLSQVAGFVAGAAVVAALNPYRTLLVDAASFGASALLVAIWVKRRPSPERRHSGPPALWSIARDGARLVFRHPVLRTLVLLGWVAGFYMLPEALAAPYAQALGNGPVAVGLLMAAMPVGTILSAVGLIRLVKPPVRLRMLGWLAMLACAPLIASAAHPPLPVVLALWVLSGIGSGYQLAAAAAFLQSLPQAGRGAAFGVAESGLLAVQGMGFLAGGAAAQVIGPELVVAVAGVAGLGAATLLALTWARLHPRALPLLIGGPEPATAAETAQAP